jgi:WD40 repeat protein
MRWADASMLVLDPKRGSNLVVPGFSKDGRWLSLAGGGRTDVLVWRQDGSGPVVLGGHSASAAGPIQTAWISENELVTGHRTEGRARIWSFPGGDLVREIDFGAQARWRVGSEHLFAEVVETDDESGHEIVHLRSWRFSGDGPVELGTFDRTALGTSDSGFDPDGSDWVYTKGSEIFCRPLPVRDGVPDRLIGSNENEAWIVWHLAEPDRLWTVDTVTGESRLWDLSASNGQPLEVLASVPGVEEGMFVVPSADGRWLHDMTNARDGKALLWDPLSVPGANPRELKRSGSWYASTLDFHPDGEWITASTDSMAKLSFWPLRSQMPTVVSGYDTFAFRPVVFTPDGEWLATYWGQDRVRLWPLPGSASRETRDLEIEASNRTRTWLAIDPAGERVFVTGYGEHLFVLSLDDGEPRRLDGFEATTFMQQGAFSPSGRLAAAAASFGSGERELQVWDLETGENKRFELPAEVNESAGEPIVQDLAFADESTLFTAGQNGVLRWDLQSGTHEQLVGVAKPGQRNRLWLSGDRQQLITGVGDAAGDCGPLVLHDLAAGQSRELVTFVRCGEMQWVEGVVFDATLSVMAVAGDDGIVRVGRVGSGSPHLLTGHGGPIRGVAISPDGRWIASSGEDNTIRLWPMPDLDRPPLHTLPFDELLEKLRSMTNLRVVRDPGSPDGWTVTLDPFPGWAEVPTW